MEAGFKGRILAGRVKRGISGELQVNRRVD